MEQLLKDWIEAKEMERSAIATRRELEDKIKQSIGFKDDVEINTLSMSRGGYKLKITPRINKKIDTDLLQQIAAENDIPFTVLQSAFRWKAEINAREWTKLNSAIAEKLSQAVTTTAGRSSIEITEE